MAGLVGKQIDPKSYLSNCMFHWWVNEIRNFSIIYINLYKKRKYIRAPNPPSNLRPLAKLQKSKNRSSGQPISNLSGFIPLLRNDPLVRSVGFCMTFGERLLTFWGKAGLALGRNYFVDRFRLSTTFLFFHNGTLNDRKLW